jgi:hypothetical protein
MRSDRSVPRRVFRSQLWHLARAGSAAALALMVVTCHSDNPVNTCTVGALAFTVQPPSTTAAGSIIPVTVAVRDGSGQTLTCFNDQVTIALGANPGGGTLSVAPVSAISGVATFNSLMITKAATGYALKASVGTISVTSSTFSITAGPATALAFTTQPVPVAAGDPISVTVTARDQFSNTVTSYANSITIAIQSNPGNDTLSGTKAVVANSGIANFTNLSIDKVGTGYSLTATPTAGAPPASATSNAFNVNPGPTTQLVFTTPPASGSAGSPLPAIVVTAQDAKGNTTPTFIGGVTLAIGANPGAGTLSGGGPISAVAGVATFPGVSINKPGTGYTLTASSGVLTPATSGTFDIAVGPLAQLVFTQQPTDAVAGVTIAPAVTVTGQDAAGNTVTTFSGNVTVAIGTNAGGGTLSGTATQPAAAGVATFNGLSIQKAGTGYTLVASSGSVTPVVSSAFTITHAAAAKLSFTRQPSTTAAGSAITPAVEVTALDEFDNVATSFTGNVMVAIGTNPKSAKLTGTATLPAASGVAAFATLKLDSAGVGYTLTATASGLTDGTSSTFDITPGTATHLAFNQQPTNATAGAGIAPAVTVRALDAQGNVATGYATNVTVAIGNNPGNTTLKGTATVTAVGGVAAFPGLHVDVSGTGYTLAATSGALTGVTSGPFDILAGPATHLVFTVQPSNTSADSAFKPALQVAAQDALGNTDLTYSAPVTLAIDNNPGGGALTGGGPVNPVLGVATFSALSLNKVGTGYTLAASSGSLTGATSDPFAIFASTATHLIFSTGPVNTVAGVTMANVVVQALDGSNNLATGFIGGVTIAIGNNTGGGTLSGAASPVSAVGGVASFSTLSIDKSGDGYTLIASASGVSSATSGSFKITPAAATHLVFSVQPRDTVAGAPIAKAVEVSALDGNGNLDTAYILPISLSISTNPSGAVLKGSTSTAAVHGVATFADTIEKSGVAYRLTAHSGSLTDATSDAFTISPAALASLVFTGQPSNTTAAQPISPVEVTGQDAFGNVVTSFNDSVAIAITTNTGTIGATLGGTTKVAASGGIATFSNLSIDKAGPNYTLTATNGGAAPAVSNQFNITAAAATMLVFTAQPGTTTAGQPMALITVEAKDAQGNTDPTFVDSVAIAIETNGGTPTPGVLSGPTKVKAAAGIATFASLSIDRSGPGYTLRASSAPLTQAASSAFDILPGAATHLVFSVQPHDTVAGKEIAPAIEVSAQDANGNTDTSYIAAVAVAITGLTGNPSAHLSGVASHAASAGVASFPGLSIDLVGANYTLTASSGTLTAGVSATFNVDPGKATHLAFSVQPHDTAAGAAIVPAVAVSALDDFGNIDTSYAKTVTLTLPATTTVVPNNNAVAASHGIATFTNLSINQTGLGYQLQGDDDGTPKLTTPLSNAFTIGPAAANHLFFRQQPTPTLVGVNINPAVVVEVRDILDNIVTTFNGNVTIAKASGPGNLGGLGTRAALSGVATFPTLDLNAAGTYVLTASSAGVPSLPSNSFLVSDPVATQLFFTGQPANVTAGTALPAMTVEIRDAAGNVVASPNVSVSLAIKPGTGTDGASLKPTDPVTVTSSAGVATFTGVSIDKAGSSYQLTATAAGLISANSKFFSIRPGAATQLAFTIQPSNAIAGDSIRPAVEVTALDPLGNADTSSHDSISVSITTNPGSGILSGTVKTAPVKGIASFRNLNINNQGAGYKLTATNGSLTSSASTPFDITTAAGNHLVFSVPPATTVAGDPISGGSLAVQVRDGSNAIATTFVGSVTLSITANTGPAGATLRGTLSRAVVNGVAAFNDVNIDKSANLYKVSAVATGAAGATSGFFNITPGKATHVVFTSDPQSTTAGTTFTTEVTAQDSLENTDTSFTDSVRVSISTNPGSGTLSGDTVIKALSGVATFPNLSINRSGGGYRLTASSGTLTSDVSNGFSIRPGTATHLVFTVAPNNTAAGSSINPPIRVAAYDALGNVDTTFANPMTVAIQDTATAGASLSGTKTVTANKGEAIFPGLSINLVGAGYTLKATASGVTEVVSAPFIIN